ncbi:MAG: hypothetical protein FWH54_03890 [Methanobrevibacter sp.]|nr:hypothetical protein [Methanobrevibacter sp.]
MLINLILIFLEINIILLHIKNKMFGCLKDTFTHLRVWSPNGDTGLKGLI